MPQEDYGPASILTNKQRSFLLGNTDIDPENSDGRSMRTRIRERVRNAFADFYILYHNLQKGDREGVFDFLVSDDTDGEVGKIEITAYREALVAMLAFVYRETNDRNDEFKFDRLLEDAVRMVEDEPLLRFTFEIEKDDPWSFDELADKVMENGIKSLDDSEMRAFIRTAEQEGIIGDETESKVND